MGKGFSNFTYGVGLEVNATSFKQIKDELKLNLDNLSKMVKSYGKVLKIDPNADLSKLFEEMNRIKSIIDGINSSDNSFAGFVDKGVLGRIASLESGLQSVSTISNEVKANLSDLMTSVNSVTKSLKDAGQAKFPATFDNLFGSVNDQSDKIKNIQNQIKTLETELTTLGGLFDEIEKSYHGKSTLGKGANIEQIQDWIVEFEDLKEKLANKKDLNFDELLQVTKQISDIGIKLNNVFQTMPSNQLKSFGINNEYMSSIKEYIVDIGGTFDNLIRTIKQKKQELNTQLADVQVAQKKYQAKQSVQASSGKSMGVQSDYTAQVKVTPKTNESEWVAKINDTLKNIEPQLTPVKLTPTFSKGKNLEKETEGNLAQINHAINVDLQVTDNIEKFNEKIKNIDTSIRNAKQQLEKAGSFKIRFDYEEGGKFKDAAYKIINQFKKIDARFYIANGNKFIQDVAGLRKKSTTELKDIPATFTIGDTSPILTSVDDLRSKIEEKLSNISINLKAQNVSSSMVGAVSSNSSGADLDTRNASQGVVELSQKAQEAQSKIALIKNTLKSLVELGFKSPDFLKLGAFDENLEYIKGSKENLQQLMQEYDKLYKKLNVSKDELRKTYGQTEEGYAAYAKDDARLKKLEEFFATISQSQVQYAKKRLESMEQILAKEMEIAKTKKEQDVVDKKDKSNKKSDVKSQNAVDVQTNKELGMSAEEATKKIRSLNGTLTQQKRVLKDLESNKFNATSFTRLGEWDKQSQSFKKNSQYIAELINKYKELRSARIAEGGKVATGEEASVRGKLAAILREQKKHITDIISKNQAELESVKQISAAYKQAKDNKTKSTKPSSDIATSTKQIDDLVLKLNKAKETLKLLKSQKFDALGSTGLGDINKRLKLAGSKESFEDLINVYNRLIAKRDELEKAGKAGSPEYIQLAKIYQGVEQQLSVIYQDQLKYTQSKIKNYETQISKARELMQTESQQIKGEKRQQIKSTSTQKTPVDVSSTTSTVSLDSASLNTLAKDATLQSIDGKINSIVSQLDGGINIDGSNISIQASNVSVSGKSAGTLGTPGAGKNAGEKEVKLSTISSYSQQLIAFEERIKRAGLYTDDLKKKFSELYLQLNEIKVQDDADTYKFDLDRFKEDFEQLKTYDELYQDFVKSQTKQIQLNDQIATSDGPTSALQEQLKIEEEKSRSIEVQLEKHTALYNQRVRQLAIDEAIKKANQEIAQNTAVQSDKDINKQNTELAKIVSSAQKQYNNMQYTMKSFKVPMADSAIAKLKEFEQLLGILKQKQQEVLDNPNLLKDKDYSSGFDELLKKMQDVQGKFSTLQKSSESFLSKIKRTEDIKPLTSIFDPNDLAQLHNEMQEFANQAGVGAAKLIEFNDVERKATFEIQNGKGQVQQLTVAYDEATNSLGRFTSKTTSSLSETQKFFNSLKHSFQNVARYVASFGSVYRIFAMIKQGVTYVREIDSALTELKKVTNETDAAYDKFLQTMSQSGQRVGSTVKDLTSSAADWARLGYSMQEAGELAENTAILMNVSEFDNVNDATDTLISSLQAFKTEGADVGDFSKQIIDKFNEVGNNYAISTSDLAESLTRSNAALVAANNSIDEVIAMTTAANTTIQDPESVGNALKVVSMRIRGVKTELEDAGEETDGMVTNTAKLQEKIMALTNIDGSGGIDILTNTGEFKSTYEILLSISKVWKKMGDTSQAALLELIAGKTRGSVVAALLQNGDIMESALGSSKNAAGSAEQELNTYLDSIEGRIDLFTNKVQTMWMNTLDSDMMKLFVDLGTFLIDGVDKLGLFETALAGVLTYISMSSKNKFDLASALGIHDLKKGFSVFGKQGFTGWIAKIPETIKNLKSKLAELKGKKDSIVASSVDSVANSPVSAIQSETQAYSSMLDVLSQVKDVKLDIGDEKIAATKIDDISKAAKNGQSALLDYVSTLGDGDAALKAYVASVEDGNYSLSGFQQFIQNHNKNIKMSGVAAKAAAVGHQLLNAALSMGISLLASFAIDAVIKGFDKMITTSKESAEAAEEAINKYKESQNTLASNKDTINNLKDDYQALAMGVDEFGNNISLTTSQYERYNEIVNQIADMFPQMVRGYTDEGNAIIKNKGNVEQLTEAYKALKEQVNDDLLNNASNIMKNYKNTVDGSFWSFDNSSSKNISASKLLETILREQDTFDFEKFGDQYRDEEYDTILTLLNGAGISRNTNESNADYVKRAISDFPGVVQSIINSWNSTVDSAVSNVKPLVSAYLDTSIGYESLTDAQKSVFNSIASSFDSDFFSQFNGDATKMYQTIENMILNLKDAGIDDEYTLVLNAKTQFNNGDISVGEYQKQIQNFISQIDNLQTQGYLGEDDVKYIKMSLGFKFDTEGNLQSDVDTMVNHAKSVMDTSKETVKSELERLSKGGAVDLLIRPQVEASVVNSNGWEVEEGSIATVLSKTFSNEDGSIAMNFTPIIVDENGKYKDMLTPDELQTYAEEVISGVREDDLNLKIGATYEGNDAIAQAERDARTIHELHDLYFLDNSEHSIDDLSYSDLQIINSEQFNVDGSTIATWEQLQHEIQLAKIAMTEDFTTDNFADYAESIGAIQTNISTYQEALEKLDSGSFTFSDFIALIEEFPDLADGVDVSSKSFNGLSKNLRKAIRNAPDELVDELKDLREQLEAAGKDTTYIDQLINSIENMPVDAVKNLTNEYITLGDKINEAKRAQNELQEAMQENPNEGYETRGEAMEYMKDKMSRGEIGSESELWSVAEAYGFTYDSAKSINQNADALANFIAIREKWYATDEDGNYTFSGTESFLNDVEKVVAGNEKLQQLGVKWNYDENTGSLDFDFNNADWDEVVKVLGESKELAGLTSEEFYDLLMQVGQFFDIKWQDANDLIYFLSQINNGSESAAKNFEDVESAVESFLTSQGYSTDLLELNVDSEEVKKLPEDVQKVLQEYYELKKKFESDPLSISWQLNKNSGEELNEDSIKSLSQLTPVMKDLESGTVFIDYTDLKQAGIEAEYSADAMDNMIEQVKKYNNVCGITRTAEDPLGLISLKDNAKMTEEYLSALQVQFETVKNSDNTVSFKVDAGSVIDALVAQGWDATTIQAYLTSLEQTGTYSFTIDGAQVNLSTEEAQQKIDSLIAEKQGMSEGETTQYTVTGTGEASVNHIASMWAHMPTEKSTRYTIYETTIKSARHGGTGGKFADGTAHAQGTAFKSGSWGAPRTETALVGELGPELLVRGSRWTTVGGNGAEFTQIKKGDIIFNHKQTEDLLSKGYVTSRGKAYASGTAYASGGGTFTKYTFDGSGSYTKSNVNSNSAVNNTSKIASSVESAADSAEEFEETFDWIEVRLEEINEQLDLMNAKLENAVGYAKKNSIIDNILDTSNSKMENLQAGLKEYTDYAAKLLAKIPSEYREAAQDGAIAITEFVGEADEKTVEAINNYRDWAAKVADLTQQIEDLKTEIADLAKQKFDNISDEFDNITTLIENQNEKLEAQVDLMEDRGYVAATQYYETMVTHTQNMQAELEKEKQALLAVLNEQVKLGNIQKYDERWYEMVDAIYEVDDAIVECTSSLEEYQNAINDIYWDNFDELINRLDYLKDETQGLIDLMDSDDMHVTPEGKTYEGGTVKYWTADDVEWTDEGIASLGLYAQQMEIAEYQSRQYAEAIDDLNKDFKAGKYSESEYLEKLNELTSAQYDSIESYYEAQDAIVELNEARIDAIKDGIEKEIEAYEELIDKKKEELDAEKDLYDFQKSTMEQQKDIADIQRKLAALSGDNSASAVAKRKKLEADLVEAQAELEESYYDRSIENQQNALDKELEDFQNEKDAEIEKWEEYLTNVETVVADSLTLIQDNALSVYDTLNAKASEYDLTLSDAIMTPWQDGALAVSDYQTTFDTAMSSTMDQLEAMKMKWQEIIDKMAEAAGKEIASQKKENDSYTSVEYVEPTPPPTPAPEPAPAEKEIAVGGKINAGSAKIYGYAGGTGYSQYFKNDPIYTVLAEQNGYLKVRHHKLSSGVTGWFKKSDVKAYAKGTKGVDKDQWALIDELGEELVLRAGANGRLEYMTKGTGVVPADLTSNLMEWGELNPQEALDRSRPSIGVSPDIHNTEINLDCSIGELIHIDKCDQGTLPDVEKIAHKAVEQHIQKINQSLRKYTR